jgi:hypothetical protein
MTSIADLLVEQAPGHHERFWSSPGSDPNFH